MPAKRGQEVLNLRWCDIADSAINLAGPRAVAGAARHLEQEPRAQRARRRQFRRDRGMAEIEADSGSPDAGAAFAAEPEAALVL